MKRTLIVLIFLFISFVSLSQERYCLFDKTYAQLIEEEKIALKQEKSTSLSKSETIFVIPVVFHVVYNQDNLIENISDAQIISQLNALNRDFRKRNVDTTNVELGFSFADTFIEFCLAKRDTNGNMTSGITRTSTALSSIGVNNEYYKIRPAWDPDNYLNIWIGEFGSIGPNEPIGVATPPGNTEKDKDGVLIDFEAFGTIGTAKSPYNSGRTCVHEVGHWLGLFHPWGRNTNSCNQDDGISDTPNQDEIYYFCPSPPRSSCGSKDMLSNYMGYVNDACMGNFTTGQKEKMRTTIVAQKSSFILTKSCGAVGLSEVQRNLNKIKLYPNPASDIVYMDLPTTININAIEIEIYNLKGQRINLELDKNSLKTSTLSNGVYLIQLRYLNKSITKRIIVQH